MSRRTWVRRSPELRETLGAAAVAAGVAAGVGGLVFWLTRLLLARDPVGRRGGAPDGGEAPGGEATEAGAPGNSGEGASR